jgi:MFS transporter, DHA3 family, multidrug efflux protein
MRTFLHILVNVLFVSVVDNTVWFAVTFWVYLETQSVFATGMVAGIFLVATSATGIWFGSLVDHHRKKAVLLAAAAASLAFYAAALAIFVATPEAEFRRVESPILWALIVVSMAGVIAGNVRTIALSTLVTMLIEPERRDRANGLVGSASGVSFLVTSAISGLLVGLAGMEWVYILAIGTMLAGMAHLAFVTIAERRPIDGDHEAPRRIDLRGTLRVVLGIPGLIALIAFSALNNLLGGVFMALMDPYGLSLMSVEAWGFMWAIVSTGFIIGGLLIARTGLTSNPLGLLLTVNSILWLVTIIFPLWTSIPLLVGGMYIYMLLVPFAEAAEQTILQRVVPFERQGRVFGFAQSVELAAAPLTAFLISPIAQFVVIPWMTSGGGADVIGPWFGIGADRGLALVFVVAGIIGLIIALVARTTRQYRELAHAYQVAPPPIVPPELAT